MDKGLPVPKWVLIVWLKIPHMPQNLYAQFIFPSPKVLDFNEKRLQKHPKIIKRLPKKLSKKPANKPAKNPAKKLFSLSMSDNIFMLRGST